MIKVVPQMQMQNPPEESALWVPQNAVSQAYPLSVPPDIIPQNSPSKDYWDSMPGRRIKRPTKQLSMGSADSGLSLHSLKKDHIELTKTVKHSLTISGSFSKKHVLGILAACRNYFVNRWKAANFIKLNFITRKNLIY